MHTILTLLSLLTAILHSDAYLASNGRPLSLTLKHRQPLTPLLATEPALDDEVGNSRLFPPLELILKPSLDVPSVVALLQGQSILLLVVLALQELTGLQVLPWEEWLQLDWSMISNSALFSIPLILAGFLLDNSKWDFAKKVQRDTTVFSLRVIGRSTPTLAAAGIAALLSISAGLAEEVFFRGFIFDVILKFSNVPIAIIGSSIFFGLAHSPFTFGPSAIVEMFIGLYFAMCYFISGFNIFIPIFVHVFYDFATIFITWLQASSSLNESLREAEEKLINMPIVEPERFKALSKRVFDIVDINGDGTIDKVELVLAQRLMNVGPSLYGVTLDSVKEEFDKYDTNNDGKIDVNEFQVMMEDGVIRGGQRGIAG